MRNLVCKGVLVAAALGVASTLMQASPKADQPAARPLAFSKGAYPDHTALLLEHIQSDAFSVRDNADQLRALLRQPFLTGWEADADLLENVRAEVNEMNRLLFRLQVDKAEASPSEQKVIDRITATAVNLADTTQDAMVTLNNNQGHVYATDLEGLAKDMCRQATLIGQTVEDFEKYANALREARQLKQTLGLKNSS